VTSIEVADPFSQVPRERADMPYLLLAGFGDVTLIRRFDLRADLISALVERWRLETHTLHMSCWKCTITLEDVAMHLRVQVDGHVVMGQSKVLEHLVLEINNVGDIVPRALLSVKTWGK
ncbi:hypothetical protein J1N35_043685, partial [Gossypium stocksii]